MISEPTTVLDEIFNEVFYTVDSFQIIKDTTMRGLLKRAINEYLHKDIDVDSQKKIIYFYHILFLKKLIKKLLEQHLQKNI
ncbi:hypothetical protein K9L67_02300 [Candidatus Woesearchaeota archaeon]|nr:hypothetical protein [Candidatus Woesearchaeota archaeon]MCF7901036.1 hypothetical protein [Candidatus Woesearchaeota archaeon]MCF8013383.1 hypothetical protein [Candidatus Woesearchaeota archaeon]